MIKAKFDLGNIDDNRIIQIANNCQISNEFAKVLYSRGLKTYTEIEKFLNPSVKHLHDPFLLKGISKAVERINTAKCNNESVVIYGDYDVDGICASAILKHSLKEFGIDADVIIPERKDGYGLSEKMLLKAIDMYNPKLIITVDCGISAYKEVDFCKERNIDVIITDHHEIADIIPDCTVINCRFKDQDYPFDSLSGAGVAYKLAKAILGESADKHLDLVAVATIADSMILTDENRDLVHIGIKLINEKKCKYQLIKLLEKVSGKQITSTTIAFVVAPRINAGGRMGDVKSALDLFLTNNKTEIEMLVERLNKYNIERQKKCELLYSSAKEQLLKNDVTKKVVVLASSEWENGLIGIVSARLVEEFNRPVILFVNKDGVLHGSARSLPSINIHTAIHSQREHLVDFGGHAQAAGVTLKAENLKAFEAGICEFVDKTYDYSIFEKTVEVESFINFPLTIEFATELERLEPCGIANQKPLFAIKTNELTASAIKQGSPHISIKSKVLDMMYFYGADKLERLKTPLVKELVFELNLSKYNKSVYLKGFVKSADVILADAPSVNLKIFDNNLKNEWTSFIKIDTLQANQMISKAKKDIYGTLLVVSNIKNLKYYNNLEGVESSIYSPKYRGNQLALVAGVKGEDIQSYKKIIYLDYPLGGVIEPKAGQEIFVNTEIMSVENSLVSSDREAFAQVFKYFKYGVHKGADVIELAKSCKLPLSKEQVIFILEVFFELKIFSINRNVLIHDSNVKSNLCLSSIYNRRSKYVQ